MVVDGRVDKADYTIGVAVVEGEMIDSRATILARSEGGGVAVAKGMQKVFVLIKARIVKCSGGEFGERKDVRVYIRNDSGHVIKKSALSLGRLIEKTMSTP